MFDREAQSGVYSAPTAFRWAVLSLADDRENVSAKNTFLKEFQAACQRAGLTVDQPVLQECPRNAHQWLEHMKNLRNADFLFLVLPARGRKKDDLNLYKLTKRLAIAELGVPTQCVLHKTLSAGKGVISFVSKLLKQVVCKLNNCGAGPSRARLHRHFGLYSRRQTKARRYKSILGFTSSLNTC